MYRPNEHEIIEADFGKLIAHYLDKRKNRFLSGFLFGADNGSRTHLFSLGS